MMRQLREPFGTSRRFHRAELVESAEELPNPGRGWYQVHTFSLEEDVSLEELEWCLGREDTLALVLIDIGAYRDRPLDARGLCCVEEILRCFAEAGMEMILRIAYDHEGRAWEREPLAFRQVEEHLEQIGPLLAEYADHIYVYQGLLVGSWGEMHSSRYLAASQLSRLSGLLKEYLGGRSFLAVRRPMYWRALHPGARAEEEYRTRMGLYDDGIFGSDTDLGTYGSKGRQEAAWEEPWRPEDELEFEDKLGRSAPQGGEAVWQEGGGRRTLRETVMRLEKMHVSYLNRIHDRRILDSWRELTWKKRGPWAGMNGYDYIGRHLGYRFCVRKAEAFPSDDGPGACLWRITVENTGFSRCYQEADVWLEWNEGGEVCTAPLVLALHEIQPGQARNGSCTARVRGEVFLKAARRKDGRAILFANAPVSRRGVFLGKVLP